MHSLPVHEVVPRVAHTAVRSSIVGRVFWTRDAHTVDPHVIGLAETAALVPVLVETAKGRSSVNAALVGADVDLVHGTLPAFTVNEVVPVGADAGLLSNRVDRVVPAHDEDAGVPDLSVPRRAAACIVGRVVSEVVGATLAETLDEGKPGKASTDTVGVEVHVESANVDGFTGKHNVVIGVAFGAGTAVTVDRVGPGGAVAVKRVGVKYGIGFAEVAFGLETVRDFYRRFATVTAGGDGGDDSHDEQ